MNKVTENKILFLQQYVKKWHKRWQKKHPENIVGFRVGKKISNGKIGKNYSIIFMVVKKKEGFFLKKKNIIPDSIEIKFPNNKKRVIKTDVQETGKIKLHAGITGEVTSEYSIHFGSAGLFVKDSSNKTYLLTNYHVVAEAMISNRIFSYKRPLNQTQPDVRLIDSNGQSHTGRFEEGIISHEIDVAFVEFPIAPDHRLNILPDNKRVEGKVATRPLPPSIINREVTVYSYYNQMGQTTRITDNSSILHINENIFFEDVLQLEKVTKGGDSGGLVLAMNMAVLAIIVGGDNDSSYAIPFFKIDDFKNVDIL